MRWDQTPRWQSDNRKAHPWDVLRRHKDGYTKTAPEVHAACLVPSADACARSEDDLASAAVDQPLRQLKTEAAETYSQKMVHNARRKNQSSTNCWPSCELDC